MATGLLRVLEWVFCIYFATHIPITLFLDGQQVFPEWMIPKIFIDINHQYQRDFKDAVIANAPEWLMPFFWDEVLLQFPFFFVGTYAFYKGSCSWVRVPCLVYAVHVATTLQPIMAYILLHDFSDESPEYPGPATLEERLKLLAVYMPYFIIPVMMIITMVFSSEYNGSDERKQKLF
ncbi:sigma intracellular receptor 2-like [Amphiura filiformis]|uniref:sigma intracellular receptor 2-like n=1 Tax=Amphiura filiformis TaxID=82378 RepID=UPI003B21CA42